jgi:hypothetical protein
VEDADVEPFEAVEDARCREEASEDPVDNRDPTTLERFGRPYRSEGILDIQSVHATARSDRTRTRRSLA